MLKDRKCWMVIIIKKRTWQNTTFWSCFCFLITFKWPMKIIWLYYVKYVRYHWQESGTSFSVNFKQTRYEFNLKPHTASCLSNIFSFLNSDYEDNTIFFPCACYLGPLLLGYQVCFLPLQVMQKAVDFGYFSSGKCLFLPLWGGSVMK